MSRKAGVRVGVLVVGVCVLFAGYYLFKNRTHYHWYHLVSLALRGDIALQRTLDKYKGDFISQDHKRYVKEGERTESFALKWRFRPFHAVPTYPIPVVDDTDDDGVPEVYIGSYTREVQALDGRNGRPLWSWKLPFGVVGGRSLALIRLNGHRRNALIVGSHTTLPIRVYALNVDAGLKSGDRLLWSKNLAGDFIEGGLNVTTTKDGEVRIVAATRDAPYSRGSLNILDSQGRLVTPSISGLDVCLNRPAIGDLNGDGKLDLIHGSHKFYKARFGYMVVAREMDTGKLLWKRLMDFDTGNRNHGIVDFDGDGRPEVIANDVHKAVILDGRTGEIKKVIPMEYLGYFRNDSGELFLLMRDSGKLIVLRKDGSKIYRIIRHGTGKPIDMDVFGVRLPDDRGVSLMVLSHSGQELIVTVYDFETGLRKERHVLEFEPPPPPPKGARVFQGVSPEEPNPGWLGFVSLVDMDGDGFWEIFFQVDDYLYAIDTPFKIADGYRPYAPIPFRNITNAGIIFGSKTRNGLSASDR